MLCGHSQPIKGTDTVTTGEIQLHAFEVELLSHYLYLTYQLSSSKELVTPQQHPHISMSDPQNG